MDTAASKAFWLGRNVYIIGFNKALGSDSPETAILKHSVENFARSLNIGLSAIPPLNSVESIKELTETVRMDLATVQSEFVGNCFQFGFHFTAWAIARGGYEAEINQSEPDREKMEANLREEARLIGLHPKHFKECIEAARNPSLSKERFDQLTGIEVVLAITKELDSMAHGGIVLHGEASKQVFVVMRMDQDLEDVLEAIQKAAAELDLVAIRVDQLDTSGRITDSIVEGIRKAAFVVVDLTDARPNVYWEAGFAHGLGKTPIYIAREGTKLEFDIKDYPVIYYPTMKKLREGLGRRLKSLLE